MGANDAYETVIGLEVHVELATKSKIFCACSTAFGAEPNTQTCPVCTGMPGALPVLNRRVLEHAIAVGLALHCEIAQYSRFDRKNYFYPDNPQNYQISQLYLPICRNGYVEIEVQNRTKRIGIHEMHMEEDAGKLIHDETNARTLIDYNRSGVPLLEIVSEPDMGTAEEVIAYLDNLRLMIQYLGAGDCKLQEGSMRVDVNLSVRKPGEALGTRTEMKNLGSFRAVRRAIEAESARQIALLASGETVRQETRRWDEGKNQSFSMRSKEDADDYRYFPDPDLLPIVVSREMIEQIRAAQPELRAGKMERYRTEYAIPEYDIGIITGSKALADLFEKTIALGAEPKQVSNWIMGETLRLLKKNLLDPEELVFSPFHLKELIAMVEEKSVNLSSAKLIFEEMFENDIDPRKCAEERGLLIQRDDGLLRRTIEEVLQNNEKSVADYKNGKDRAFGFLVGQTMKAMKGKADPAVVNRMLSECLEKWINCT